MTLLYSFAASYSHIASGLVPLSWGVQDFGLGGWVLGIPTVDLDVLKLERDLKIVVRCHVQVMLDVNQR